MMNNKKILVVYPHNFLQGLHGTNMNIYQLLKIFKEINYDVDVFAYEGFTPDSNFSNFNEQNSEGLVNKLHLYDFGKSKKISRSSIVRKIKIIYKIGLIRKYKIFLIRLPMRINMILLL